MKSRTHKSTVVALAAVALLALPAVATSATDYSKNGATGDYAHGPLPPAVSAKDYSKNGATGDYVPAETPSVQVETVADNGGFAWDDAAIGAGVALALALIALGATTLIRRRRASPAGTTATVRT
jgi:hypothetical protein